MAAFQALSYEDLLSFLGVSPSTGRLQTYQRLRKRLSPVAAAFWDGQSPSLEAGIIHAGKLERFLKIGSLHRLSVLQTESTE